MADENPVLVLDCGACEWRCGFDCDSGPNVVLPGVGLASTEVLRAQLSSAFEQLEANPSEHEVLLSEAPGALAAARERIASILFADHGIRALHVAAAPLLAMYSVSTAGFNEPAPFHLPHTGCLVLMNALFCVSTV
jgi:hypothetical protein